MGADLDELETLYRDRYRAFAAFVTATTGEAVEAHDVVQDAFVAAVRKRRRFRGDGSLEAWVWRIVLNKARDRGRKLAREPRVVPASGSTNGHHEDAELRVVLARLPRRQREAVFLRYYAELDYGEIAEILGISSGTVGATLNAARSALRRMVEVHDG